MGKIDTQQWLNIVPTVLQQKSIQTLYDAEADVLYINFMPVEQADDSEMTDDDIILRYKGGDLIGMTILNAHERVPA